MHPRIEVATGMLEMVGKLAVISALAAAKQVAHSAHRRKSQVTLKPGHATPLWNEVSQLALQHCRKRGDRAKLGRILGVPRQRVHEMLRSRKTMPNAERTLMLLMWLSARERGSELA